MIPVFPYSKRIQKIWHYNLGKIAKCTSIGKRLCLCSVCYDEKCFAGFAVSNYRGREFCSKLKTQKHRKASSTHGKVPIAVGFSLNSDTTLFKFVLPRKVKIFVYFFEKKYSCIRTNTDKLILNNLL